MNKIEEIIFFIIAVVSAVAFTLGLFNMFPILYEWYRNAVGY